MKTVLNYPEIERKIKTMSAYEIIMAMVKGLRKPRTIVDMTTFAIDSYDRHFADAATNTVLYIANANKRQTKSHIKYRSRIRNQYSPLWGFEEAIHWLRQGCIEAYNECADESGFAPIAPIPGKEMPCISSYYTEEELQEYVKLAEYNK